MQDTRYYATVSGPVQVGRCQTHRKRVTVWWQVARTTWVYEDEPVVKPLAFIESAKKLEHPPPYVIDSVSSTP
jgi:hypothetical protein